MPKPRECWCDLTASLGMLNFERLTSGRTGLFLTTVGAPSYVNRYGLDSIEFRISGNLTHAQQNPRTKINFPGPLRVQPRSGGNSKTRCRSGAALDYSDSFHLTFARLF